MLYSMPKKLMPHKAKHHSYQHNLLDERQWGAGPMISADNLALIDEYVNQISKMTCAILAKLQNNAAECFDRQVNSHVILNSRKYEIPDQACKLPSETLRQTNHHVKTALGVLDTSYCITQDYPFYGTG